MIRRRPLTFLSLLTALLTLSAIAGGWYLSARAFQDALERWVAERRAEGYVIANAEPRITGFPLRVRATFQDPAITAPQGWRWQAPEMTAEAFVWALDTVHIQAPGEHAFAPVPGPALRLESKAMESTIIWGRQGVIEVGFRLYEATLSGRDLGQIHLERLETLVGPQRQSGARPITDFRLEGEAITLPPGLSPSFERRLESFLVEGDLTGRLPAQPARESLEAWRREGGVINFSTLWLDWPPVSLDGEGSLSLDRDMRPLGAFTAEMRGLTAALDRMVASGMLDARMANYVKIAVNALSRRDDEDGERYIELPISLQDGQFFLGPVPLFPLSPVL